MAKDTSTEVRTDWLGQEYRVGDLVLYSALRGHHGNTVTLARVAKLNATGTVGVIPIKSPRKTYGTWHWEDERNPGVTVYPYADDRDNKEIVAERGGYYVKATGEWLGPRYRVDAHNRAVRIGLDNCEVREFQMQPWVVRVQNPQKVVTLVVTENITRWNGELPDGLST